MYESRTKSDNVDYLYDAILSLKTREECYRFFDDLCTIPEVIAMGQRLYIAKMLAAGETYDTITAESGISSTTISRINRCIKYGNGGYEMAIDRLKEQEG